MEIDGYEIRTNAWHRECYQSCQLGDSRKIIVMIDDVERPEIWLLCPKHFKPAYETKTERSQNICLYPRINI